MQEPVAGLEDGSAGVRAFAGDVVATTAVRRSQVELQDDVPGPWRPWRSGSSPAAGVATKSQGGPVSHITAQCSSVTKTLMLYNAKGSWYLEDKGK